MSSDFCHSVRVYLEDTDAGGIVFYANYLKFFERARTEFVRAQGFEMRRSLTSGIGFVVAGLALDYRRSAYLDDELNIFVAVKSYKKTYFEVSQWAERKSEPGVTLVQGTIKVACVDLATGKPRRMPSELEQALKNKEQ